MQRIEGILRVIAQDSHSPSRVQTAEDSVAKLRAQLVELQQSEAALEGQVSPVKCCLCFVVLLQCCELKHDMAAFTLSL